MIVIVRNPVIENLRKYLSQQPPFEFISFLRVIFAALGFSVVVFAYVNAVLENTAETLPPLFNFSLLAGLLLFVSLPSFIAQIIVHRSLFKVLFKPSTLLTISAALILTGVAIYYGSNAVEQALSLLTDEILGILGGIGVILAVLR